METMPLNIWVG